MLAQADQAIVDRAPLGTTSVVVAVSSTAVHLCRVFSSESSVPSMLLSV